MLPKIPLDTPVRYDYFFYNSVWEGPFSVTIAKSSKKQLNKFLRYSFLFYFRKNLRIRCYIKSF